MSKKIIKNQDMKSSIMQEIEKGGLKMKPRWLFVAGSVLAIFGLVAAVFTSAFLVNLIIFMVKKQGPGIGKLNNMLAAFPLWVPAVAILGIVAGILLLKKYDFSYKKNFALIVVAFIVAVIFAGFAIDRLGLNDVWSRRGVVKGLYQGIEKAGSMRPEYYQNQGGQKGVGSGYNRNR